jgi:hypothetical protein
MVWRIFGYWFLYHLFLWNALLLFYFMQYRIELLSGGPARSFGELCRDFTVEYLPLLLAAMAVLPLVLYDAVRTTHRVAGPLVRFRKTLEQLRNGERVEKVQLRKGDLLVDFQQEFNEFLKFYNARLDHLPTLAPSRDAESTILSDVRNLSAGVTNSSQQRSVDVRSSTHA